MDHLLPSFNKQKSETALLVGIYTSKRDRSLQEASLEELARLAETAGASVNRSRLCELRTPHPPTLIGRGKVEELSKEVKEKGYHIVIFDEDLTPAQNRNLEASFGSKVIDRTGLILDIFARRAKTREGKIQVELAQLRYLLPRLVGHGGELSQLAGGIGTRGPGETRLEMDRRKARIRISLLQRELKKVRSHRELHRKKRDSVPIPLVALVGYTNAGKSTLMNALTDAGVLVEDKLFATLDPTVRRLKLPSGREILVSDTVGFVRKLPHQLVDSFRATFEEIRSADLLIHLVDASHPELQEQRETVEKVLQELGLDRKPLLTVFNKIDLEGGPNLHSPDLRLSALTGEGLESLLKVLEEKLSLELRHVTLKLPYDAGSALSLLYRTSRVLWREDAPDGIHLEAELNEKTYNKFRRFLDPPGISWSLAS